MDADRQHELVGEPDRFADNIEVAVGDRIKRPDEERNPLHKRGLARAEVGCKTSAARRARAIIKRLCSPNAGARERSAVGLVVWVGHGVRVSGKTYGISLSFQRVIVFRIIVMAITVAIARLSHCDQQMESE